MTLWFAHSPFTIHLLRFFHALPRADLMEFNLFGATRSGHCVNGSAKGKWFVNEHWNYALRICSIRAENKVATLLIENRKIASMKQASESSKKWASSALVAKPGWSQAATLASQV